MLTAELEMMLVFDRKLNEIYTIVVACENLPLISNQVQQKPKKKRSSRFDTNRPVQLQKMARSLKFQI